MGVRSAAWLGAVIVAASACAETAPEAADPAAERVRIELAWRLNAASEEYVCRYYVVPEGGLDVVRADYELGPHGHHLLVWSTSLTADALATASDPIRRCDTDAPSHAAITGLLLGAQPGAGSFVFPDGAALRLLEGQVLLVEHHAVNGTAQATDVQAGLALQAATGPISKEVGLLHYYDWAIAVPPQSRTTARMRCLVPQSLELISVHGHMHARGNSFRAWTLSQGEGAPFYESQQWDAAPRGLLPSVAVAAGDGIELECAFTNAGATSVYQGLSATEEEMCSLTAFYVTRDGRRMSAISEWCGEPGSGIVGSGTVACAGIEACLLEAHTSLTDAVARKNRAQDCWLTGCAAATLGFRDLAVCRAAYCLAPCGVAPDSGFLIAETAESAACQTCLAASCAEYSAACAAATCGGL